MKPNLALDEKNRSAVGQILNNLLANEFLLYVKTRNYHWNVTGSHFTEYHKLFEAQYDSLAENVDAIAERARALGVFACGSMKEFLALATLKETSGKRKPAAEMLQDLLNDHETLVRALRKDLAICAEKHQDAGTSDFLTGLMEEHEKTAWMLRAHLD